ncbi:T-cell receptor beta chain V region 3H.25, partial [Tupaia chinensis]
CFMVLCLVATGSLDEYVTQTPQHLLKGKGQKIKIHFVPRKGHIYVFWYQQILTKELKFLISFQNENVLDKTGLPRRDFSAKCTPNSPCSLKIQLGKLQDSAVYLCASSEYTVLSIGQSESANTSGT